MRFSRFLCRKYAKILKFAIVFAEKYTFSRAKSHPNLKKAHKKTDFRPFSAFLCVQIVFFDQPPRDPQNQQREKQPKAPAHKFIVPVSLPHFPHDLYFIRYTIAHVLVRRFDLAQNLVLIYRVDFPHRIAFFDIPVRRVYTIDAPLFDRVCLHPFSVLYNGHVFYVPAPT